MDTAISLRMCLENEQDLSGKEMDRLLGQSKLVEKLTADYLEHPLFSVFRIVGLSEIPHVERLPYTQKLLRYINRDVSTKEGFSCLGGVKELVPCYNAMLLEAYSRLGLAASNEAQAALRWIKQYQLFERNQVASWPHAGVCKHGGCLGKTPCYIGVGKTVRALITYLEFAGHDEVVEDRIAHGAAYMLGHKMYQRRSNGEPISPHITDIVMPQNYVLSFTDLIYIAGKCNLTGDENAAPLLALLREKEIYKNHWKVEYLYRYKGYVGFEGRRSASEWISFLFPRWLSNASPQAL